MASTRSVWNRLLGVEGAVVEDWEVADDGSVVVAVRVARRARRRCPQCQRRCPGYDAGAGRRRWRGLDLGTTRVYLEAAAPRVRCRTHGVVVAAVPWARPRSGFTAAFEDQCAWLAVHTDRTTVAALLRVAWRTVGRIVRAVGMAARAQVDLLADLRRIGIDELSHRKGQRYVTVVVDHDTGRLVWMAPGRDAATVRAFFNALGPDRTAQLTLVSADGAAWIDDVVRERAPHVVRCLDPFHVVRWATDALDQVRRQVWNDLRHGGDAARAGHLKHARWALWKNPEHLTKRQQATLAWIPRVNRSLYRAYLLKEALRTVFQCRTRAQAVRRLDAWLQWARRSRLAPFTKLARTIRTARDRIVATLTHRVTNARVEALNHRARLLLRLAHGFHDVQAFIALAMLKLSGLCPPLPGRNRPTLVA